MKRLLVGCFIAIFAAPGFSQPRKAEPTYYVVLNTLTKQCSVANKPPRTDTPNITVASDEIYETRAQAEAATKTLKPCKPE